MPKADDIPAYIYRKDMMKAFEELGIPTDDVLGIVVSHSKMDVIRKRRDSDGNYVIVNGDLVTEQTTIGIRNEADRP